MSNRSYAAVADDFRRKLILTDTLAICIPQALILWFRDYSIDLATVSGTIDLAIICLVPLLYLYFLSTDSSWESQIFLGSLKFYEIPFLAGCKAAVSICAFAYIVKEPISRITVISILSATILSVLLARFILRHSYISKLLNSKTVRFIVLATKEEFNQITQSTALQLDSQIELIHRTLKDKYSDKEWNVVCKDLETDTYAGIIISDEYFPKPHVLAQISTIQSIRALEVFIFSPLAVLLPRFKNLQDNSLVKLSRPLIIGRHAFIKRFTDIVLSAIALVFLSPLLLLTALAVKTTSKGPIFYMDKRIGRNNNLFIFPKFRSMYKDADKMRSTVLGSPDESMPDRYKKDPRITPFGRFIRRWSIDELPQIWCVLIGSMSIVGPRPILREEALDVGNDKQSRFIAKPGLTGLWQVSGRKEVLWENRMQQDVLYIESWSFVTDLLLIMRTFGTIISGKGAM